jgi:hypothetical protein
MKGAVKRVEAAPLMKRRRVRLEAGFIVAMEMIVQGAAVGR